jgi:hypothetical protein
MRASHGFGRFSPPSSHIENKGDISSRLWNESDREVFDWWWDYLLRSQPQFSKYRKPSQSWPQKALDVLNGLFSEPMP